MKRFLSIILCLALLTAVLPSVPAGAAGSAWDGSVDISWYDPAGTEFTLSTPAQLAGLAALVNGMTDPACPQVIGDTGYLKSIRVEGQQLVGAGGGNVSDTVYSSAVDFAGKTVYLAADMDMGGRYDAASGAWSGPNWTPIGGKFPMKPEVVNGDCLTLDTRFNGVLDGQGHSITNLYCDRYAQKGFPYSMAIGVVGFLGGGTDAEGGVSGEFATGWQPTVKNLVLASGSIRGRRMVGGIVGRIGTTSEGVIVENCANLATVQSTDAKGVGGIVGAGWGKGVIRSCYNVGLVTTTYASPAGGIVGSNGGLDVYNCYNAGRIYTNGQSRGRGIGGHDTGSYTVENCYYLSGCGDDEANPGYYKGLSTRITVNVTQQTAEEMKNAAFVDKLNASGAVFVQDTKGLNGGWPLLWFQAGQSGARCSLTVKQPAGGTIRVAGGAASAAFGETVALEYTAQPGYTLEAFTVNGKRLASNFFTATEDAEISAAFTKLGVVTVSIPQDRDYAVAVARQGWKLVNGELVWTERELLRSGDTLLLGNVLTVLTHAYADGSPADMDLEYIDAFTCEVTGAEKNADGSYTVTGTGDVKLTVNRRTQPKSWVRFADTSWYLSGGRRSVYTLNTAQELAGLAWLVNRGGYDFAGITIQLGRDVSLANTDGTVGTRLWTPIGTNVNKAFRGVFDGQGHAIYDLTVAATGSYAALFGCCVNATIRDLSVYGAVSGSANASYAAGVAAYLSGGVVENCSNYASVSAAGTHAGGLAAMIRDGARIENCFNYGAVTGASGVGGLVGVSDSGEDGIAASANFGTVTSTGNNTYGTGGLAGRLAGRLEGSANYGRVSGTDRYTGGLAGYASTKNASAVANCANRGPVSAANSASTAALGGLVGYGQYLILTGSENSGTVTPGAGFPAGNSSDSVGREGSVTRKSGSGELPAFEPVEARLFPTAKKTDCLVTFLADGKIVGQVPYKAGETSVAAPAVPAKEGYTGTWDNYKLGEQDLTVHALYRPILVRDGDSITRNGTYTVSWFSSGVIRVAENVHAVLDGSTGGAEGFDGLTIELGKGASLTIRDLVLSGTETLLSLAGDNTLTLSGASELLSRAEAAENAAPALLCGGDLTIEGSGSLFISGGTRNTALTLSRPGSTLELRGGTLSVHKEDLLGYEGGALYADGSTVLVSGGTLKGHTASDNVAVVWAKELHVTGGRVLLQAERCPYAVHGAVTAPGGELAAYAHDGNSASSSNAYLNAAALPGLTGTAAFTELLPFTDVFVTDSYYGAVESCCRGGIFNGTSATTFEPASPMTRAMFVTVLYRMAGQPAVTAAAPFTDLTQDWYKAAVVWAVEKGITNGTSATAFSPNTPVTREQTAVFLFRYAQTAGKGVPQKYAAVSHGELSAWAEAEVLWALSGGLFDGAREPMANPGDFAPRSLLATAVSNFEALAG